MSLFREQRRDALMRPIGYRQVDSYNSHAKCRERLDSMTEDGQGRRIAEMEGSCSSGSAKTRRIFESVSVVTAED